MAGLPAGGITLDAFTGSSSSATSGPAAAIGRGVATLGGLAWPFPGGYKSSEIRRIDQGQDLQYPGSKPTPIYAIAAGITGLGSDPAGFGSSYPTETLTKPIDGYTGVYYGHVRPVLPAGTRVRAGQQIGETFGPTSGGDAAGTPNWLEVGFLRGGQYPQGSYPTAAGSTMAALLARLRAARKPAPSRVNVPGLGRHGTLNLRTPITGRKSPAARPARTLPLLPPPRRPAARKPARKSAKPKGSGRFIR